MRYYALSFSYKKTPILLREQIAFSQDEAYSFAKKIKDHNIKEILLVSTCNRTEFYFYAEDEELAKQNILYSLAEDKKINQDILEANVEFYRQIETIHHIFCVVSSLDSVVIGETQIVGQFKSAYKTFFENGLCAKALTRLIHFAFKCAAKVRNQTEISKNAVSVASVAVRKATELQMQYHLDKKALVIGLGEMGRLSAKHLLSHHYTVMLCNRDQNKVRDFLAENKKQQDQITYCDFDTLKTHINLYPFVFSATSSPQTIITKDMIKQSNTKRFLFDLALPRDIEQFESKNIKTFVIDDLNAVVQNNLANKKESMYHAYEIVGIATMEFKEWLQNLDIEPVVKEIRQLARQASLKEIRKALKKGYITPEQQYSVEKILHQAFNTFLHAPTQNLRESANRQESDIILESIKSFFGIEDEKMLLNTYRCEYDISAK